MKKIIIGLLVLALVVVLAFFLLNVTNTRLGKKNNVVVVEKEENVLVTEKQNVSKSKNVSKKHNKTTNVFQGRIIDITDLYVVLKSGKREGKFFFSNNEKIYTQQGDLVLKDDLWINHVLRIKYRNLKNRKVISSMKVVSEINL